VGRDECACGKEVEPEQFEKDAGAQGGLQPEGQAGPEQGGEQGAVYEAQIKGEAGQREEGKKKPPPASRTRSCVLIMTIPGVS